MAEWSSQQALQLNLSRFHHDHGIHLIGQRFQSLEEANKKRSRSNRQQVNPTVMIYLVQTGGYEETIIPEFYERTYILLGDAQAKNKAYTDARKTWQDGLRTFPASRALEARLAISSDAALLDYIEDQRSLEQPIETDFSFLE